MIYKKPPLSDDEKELFRREISGTNPITQDKYHHQTTPIKKRAAQDTLKSQPSAAGPTRDELLKQLATTDWQSSESILSYKHPSLSHKRFRQLKRGQLPLQAQLDLHHHTVTEAYTQLQQFIDHCTKKQITRAIIIHGKSSQLNTKPILKTCVYKWLREHPQVLALHSAQATNGGVGATYILLKQ